MDKSRQRLYLVAGTEKGGLSIEKTMICATGEAPGDKTVLGDKKTPEGIYFCKTILVPPNLGKKYGTCALPLNYPNPIDKQKPRNGGGIWIHGIREDRTIRSSKGCIVLENKDLVYLARQIHLLTTPVIIDKNIRLISRNTLSQKETDTLKFLQKWQKARVIGDLKTYFASYGEKFLPKGKSLSRWRSYQIKLFRRSQANRHFEINITMILQNDTYEILAFSEVFNSGNVRETGFRRLYLQEINGRRKIIAEEWIPSFVLKKKWDFYCKILNKLRLPIKTYRIFYPPLNEKNFLGNNEKKEELYRGFREFIEKWKTAWEEKNLSNYLSCYSKQFRHGKIGLDAWAKYKSNIFQKPGMIHIALKKLMIHPEGENLAVRFEQAFRQGDFKDDGIKILLLRREGGAWRILEETWQRKR